MPNSTFKKFSFTTFTVIFLIFFSSEALAVPRTRFSALDCTKALTGKFLAQKTQPIQTVDDLLLAFSRGLEPDLSSATERHAFEIYRKMRFGDSKTDLPDGLKTIAKETKRNPGLKKESFPSVELSIQDKIYPVPEDLDLFIKAQTKSAGQTKSNLFQIDANVGVWKKLLGYEDKVVIGKRIPKDERERLQKQSEEEWEEFLESKIPRTTRAVLADSSKNVIERSKILFVILKSERERIIVEKGDVRAISLAMVDLVHTVGFHDASIVSRFKSTSGLERISAFRQAMDQRDSLAMLLGYSDHFLQLLKELKVSAPTGLDPAKNLAEIIGSFEGQVLSQAKTVKNSGFSRTVRQLSLTESPFRSDLGGSDCSSRTYFRRALDPNYNYFTITDEGGFSSGHVTVVLGEAKEGSQKMKVAFIDKIQNIPIVDLPVVLEAVRRATKEKGYVLALPEDLGDHNSQSYVLEPSKDVDGHDGLSNEQVTIDFVKGNIKTDSRRTLLGFKPHANDYKSAVGYSRAEQRLALHPVTELLLGDGIVLSLNPIQEPWHLKEVYGADYKLDLDRLVEASHDLKNGSLEDKLRYIPSQKAIETAGLKPDRAFNDVLLSWLKDPTQDFRLRKQALIHLWREKDQRLPQLLATFKNGDRITLLQNLLDTPRYRDPILTDKASLFELLVVARSNKKVRQTLLAQLSSKHISKMERILDAKDISDERAMQLVKQLKSIYSERDIEKIAQFQNLAEGTSLEEWFKEDLYTAFVAHLNGGAAIGRALAKGLASSDTMTQEFARRILAASSTPSMQKFKIVQAFHEIEQAHPIWARMDFDRAIEAWLASDADQVLKAEVLLAYYGASNPKFSKFFSALSQVEQTTIWEAIEKKSSVPLFRKFAQLNGLLEELDQNTIGESFEFNTIIEAGSPQTFTMGSAEDGGTREVTLTRPFSMQATKVTQAQWAAVMGANPSRFTEHGQRVQMGDEEIKIDWNRPVEQVSWEDAQEFIKRLNKADSKFRYRLASAAERECAGRSGSKTRFYFGDDVNEIGEYGWHSGNSNGQTQPVAMLRPNDFGLYDMAGNVWEWTQDWYGDIPQGPVTDPRGPRSGASRVVRGGGWDGGAQGCRSAGRYGWGPDFSYSFVGFRLVRTEK